MDNVFGIWIMLDGKLCPIMINRTDVVKSTGRVTVYSLDMTIAREVDRERVIVDKPA